LEEIWDAPGVPDWEEQLKLISSLTRAEIEPRERELCYGYGNTYTYTKNLAERHLERYGKNLKIVVCRPSMIIHCALEPL
jgi:hypothetical protein